YARGGASAYVVDATIERIERQDGGFRVFAHGATWPGALFFVVDLKSVGLVSRPNIRPRGSERLRRRRHDRANRTPGRRLSRRRPRDDLARRALLRGRSEERGVGVSSEHTPAGERAPTSSTPRSSESNARTAAFASSPTGRPGPESSSSR